MSGPNGQDNHTGFPIYRPESRDSVRYYVPYDFERAAKDYSKEMIGLTDGEDTQGREEAFDRPGSFHPSMTPDNHGTGPARAQSPDPDPAPTQPREVET